MLIKKLIQRLLDSRTTPEEAGHSAMPSASETVLLTQNDAFQSWGNIHQGVAADDGYVNIFARSVNNTTSEMRVLTSGMTFSSAQTGAEKDMACSAPVAKGQSYAVKGTQVKMIKIIFVKALGAIGGGYNHFVRRALSCLRPSFNYLSRSFCKAKNSGLAVKHSLKQLLHWMFRHVPSLHRLMGILDTSILSAVEANSCSIWIRVKKYLAVKSLVIAGFLQQTPTARQQYLSRKAVLLLLLPTRCSIKFGLLRLQARHNLRTGGALC